MRQWFVIVCVVLLSVSSGAHATKYAGEFMTLGGGARALAMGSAFTAIADDATATYWNPAGVALLPSLEGSPKGWQAIFMHAEQFGDLLDFDFFAAAFPLKAGESAWGFTFIHLGIPDIRIIPLLPGMIGNSNGDDILDDGELINFNPEDFPLESANDYAAMFSYAQRLGFGQAGASVKLIRNDQVTGVSSFGIGLDLAFIRRDLWRNIGVGVKLQDATGTYISWSTGRREFIYPTLKLGVAYPVKIAAMNSTVTIAADGDFRYENRRGASQLWLGRASADFHFGGEILIRDLVAVRGGWDMGRPTAGMGLLVHDISAWHVSLGLDYALLLHDKLNNTHRVSLMISH